ncbi:Lrp/AsnC family transcriptional regulator [Candidatus Woesearchaeota archaeon]|nr:Lrp/AsnC family transcriptional regulator [Candidatus Woesearchaeota archaeon]
MKLDQKNQMILNLLQQNCRMSLTRLAKEVSLSVDSVNKRLNKMLANGIFYPKIQLRPRHFGYPHIAEIKIKLKDFNNKRSNEFIQYCTSHPRVAEIFEISGEWNFTLVIIAKDHEDLGMVTTEIQDMFNDIIGEWSEAMTTYTHKFETYDVTKLMKYEEEKQNKTGPSDKKEVKK